MADDEYNGYHIPAGSLVLGNAWAVLHDAEAYPEPHTFNPRRFLSPEGALRDDVPFPTEVFGFGRRICPGRYFAMDTLFLAIAGMLAVFTIKRAVDEQGNVVEVKEVFLRHVPALCRQHKLLGASGSSDDEGEGELAQHVRKNLVSHHALARSSLS